MIQNMDIINRIKSFLRIYFSQSKYQLITGSWFVSNDLYKNHLELLNECLSSVNTIINMQIGCSIIFHHMEVIQNNIIKIKDTNVILHHSNIIWGKINQQILYRNVIFLTVFFWVSCKCHQFILVHINVLWCWDTQDGDIVFLRIFSDVILVLSSTIIQLLSIVILLGPQMWMFGYMVVVIIV